MLSGPGGLFYTDSQCEAARKRIAKHRWAANLLGNLRERVQGLESIELPAFETDWWVEASRKHWSEIYPEIHLHTLGAISAPNIKAWEAAGLLAVTGDKSLIQPMRRILLHYARYSFFARHPDVGLNWAVWGIRAFCAYDVLAGHLSQEERELTDDFFRRMHEAVEENNAWWQAENPGGLYNNQNAWHNLIAGTYGLMYSQPHTVEQAIHSDQGFRDLIEQGSRDDGLWFESSLNYQFTAVIAIAYFARLLANAGHPLDLWKHEFANGRSLGRLFTGPVQVLFPDQTLPTIGDCYGNRVRLPFAGAYHLAHQGINHPWTHWVLSQMAAPPFEALFTGLVDNEKPEPPFLFTRLFPEHGYVFLRSEEGLEYWSGEGFSAFLSFDLDGIHSHRDKFTLMAFAEGEHLAVDPECRPTARHAFSSQVQAELNRATLCHNTVMVDKKDHQPVAGLLDLTVFQDTPGMKLATVEDLGQRIHPGVLMRRTVAVTQNYLLDIFQVKSAEEHIYDYLYHFDSAKGPLEFSQELRFSDYNLPKTGAYTWLRNARSSDSTGQQLIVARGGKHPSSLQTNAGETQIIYCDFPVSDEYKPPFIPMITLRRQGKAAVFVTLLRTGNESVRPWKLVTERTHLDILRVTVGDGRNEREFTVPAL